MNMNCCLLCSRAPGCPPAAEERVQGRAGEDACKCETTLADSTQHFIEIYIVLEKNVRQTRDICNSLMVNSAVDVVEHKRALRHQEKLK